MDFLAALAGMIIGVSSSPEMWIAVAVVVAFSHSTKSFLMALVIAAAALVGARYAVIPGFPMRYAIVSVVALAIWSSIGWGLRTLITRESSTDSEAPRA